MRRRYLRLDEGASHIYQGFPDGADNALGEVEIEREAYGGGCEEEEKQ